ncbi:hypothetical protein [Paenibacillus luteus]|uniref:hypothetical protein n=1 Tax=Paenibacillus luteus TaxID=2545753 RepID=UPI0030C8B017
MYEWTPIMYVFAGNNGSGKRTIRNLIVDQLGISMNIDPDALVRGVDSLHPESRFELTMFNVGLGDYHLNIGRIAARVRNGGYHIPTGVIIRRHDRHPA